MFSIRRTFFFFMPKFVEIAPAKSDGEYKPYVRLEPGRYGHQNWQWWELPIPVTTRIKDFVRNVVFRAPEPNVPEISNPSEKNPNNVLVFSQRTESNRGMMEQAKTLDESMGRRAA